jgi:hypothetical protein
MSGSVFHTPSTSLLILPGEGSNLDLRILSPTYSRLHYPAPRFHLLHQACPPHPISLGGQEMTAPSPHAKHTLRRTYRYRLYPTRKQAIELEKQLGEACDLYNAALQQRREAWRHCGVSVGFYQQCAEVKDLRADELLDANASSQMQKLVLPRLDRAFQAFFRHVKAGEAPGYPRLRSRKRFDTLEWEIGQLYHCPAKR